MRKPKLFIKVKCKAYLKKHNDGVHIVMYNADGSVCNSRFIEDYRGRAIAYKIDKNTGEKIEIANLSDFDGSSVKKIYRKRIEKDFIGFIVGYTKIKVTGLIGTTWEDDGYHEYGHCFKEVQCFPVAVVYFGNCCKRYVLLDDLQEVDVQR